MLFSEYQLKGRTIKNRIVFPPVVCSGWSQDGKVTQNHLNHYQSIAKGGAGLIITEAICITPTAKLSPTQLGAWSDDFIDGLSQIVKVCHDEGVPVMAQIHHAGLQSVSGQPVVPTEKKNDDGTIKGAELSLEQIKEIEQQFVDACIRAHKAGFDGIELHGAHSYLLSFFLSSKTNHRTDAYGGSLENRARLPLDIMKRVRKECGDNFIMGIRYGGASPTLEDGIAFSKMFESAGCDILHVSWGASPRDVVEVPEAYKEFNSYLYTGIEIKKNVNIPVIAVNSIETPEMAKKLVDSGYVDFAALARAILADYDWPNKIKTGIEPVKCMRCKPMCRWFKDAVINCPARQNA